MEDKELNEIWESNYHNELNTLRLPVTDKHKLMANMFVCNTNLNVNYELVKDVMLNETGIYFEMIREFNSRENYEMSSKMKHIAERYLIEYIKFIDYYYNRIDHIFESKIEMITELFAVYYIQMKKDVFALNDNIAYKQATTKDIHMQIEHLIDEVNDYFEFKEEICLIS